MLPETPGNYPPRIGNIFWLYEIRILEHGKRYKIAEDWLQVFLLASEVTEKIVEVPHTLVQERIEEAQQTCTFDTESSLKEQHVSQIFPDQAPRNCMVQTSFFNPWLAKYLQACPVIFLIRCRRWNLCHW